MRDGIYLYVIKGCVRCTKIEKFLKDNKLPYICKNMATEKMTVSEIKDMLKLTENGFDDLVSSTSTIVKNAKPPLNDMLVGDACQFIVNNPCILHRPIIIQYIDNTPYRLLIGYNSSAITILLKKNDKKFFHASVCKYFGDHCHVTFCTKNELCDEEIEDE